MRHPQASNSGGIGKAYVLTIGAALALLWSGAVTAKTPAPAPRPAATAPSGPQMPSSEAMIILIRASLVALSQANVTNNYTVLHALGSQNFKTSNPPARLASVFESFRTNRIDLSPVVVLNPQLSAQPTLANGKLRLVGIFPSKPMQVNYDLTFEPDGGVWKLFGLGVNLSAAATAK
jgi:hypothetical protein